MTCHFKHPDGAAFHNAPTATCEYFHIPDYLVGLGFRARMLLLSSADRSCLKRAERYYEAIVPSQHCNDVLAGLVAWTLHIDAALTRRIVIHSGHRHDFSSDEARAVAIIATAQHGQREHVALLLSNLLGARACHDVVNATERFACLLNNVGLILASGNALRLAKAAT